MHGTRSATACTNSQFSGQLRFGPCGECCRFFMTIVNPLNFFVLTNLFGNAVEGISNHTVYALHAYEYQLVYNFCCDRFCHVNWYLGETMLGEGKNKNLILQDRKSTRLNSSH